MYNNIYGEVLDLKVLSFATEHGAIFEEYIIESRPFRFYEWLSYTIILLAIFLIIGLHHQHTYLLTSLCVILFLIILSKLHMKVKRESFLVIKTVGMQITTIFASGRKSAKFIAWERIQGVVINEAISMHKVLFYLAILLHCGPAANNVEILPVFQHTLPRLNCLKMIYQNVHRIVNE